MLVNIKGIAALGPIAYPSRKPQPILSAEISLL